MADDVKNAEDKLLARLPADGKESIYNMWWFTNSIEKAWPALDTALTASNPSNEVTQIQKELGRLIKQGTHFSGDKVTSQQVKDEIKKLDDAREVDRKAKLQAENNAKPKEPTPEETAKFLDSIKSPWDAAKNLARTLGGQNGPKTADGLPDDVKSILGIDGLEGQDLQNALSQLFAGKIPARNNATEWNDKIFKDGVADNKRPEFAQIIKKLAERLQKPDGSDLITQIHEAIKKSHAPAVVAGGAGGGPAPANAGSQTPPRAPVAPTAAMQKLAAENKALKEALEKETAAMNTMKVEFDKVGPQLQADEKAIRDLQIDKNALIEGLNGAQASIAFNDAVRQTTKHGVLYHLMPTHWFGHQDPAKNKAFVNLVGSVQGATPEFKQNAVGMYNAISNKQPEHQAIDAMAITLGSPGNEALLAGVSRVLASQQTTAVRQGSHDPAAQQLSASGGQQQFNTGEPGVGAALVVSAQFQPQPTGRQVYSGAAPQPQQPAPATATPVSPPAPAPVQPAPPTPV